LLKLGGISISSWAARFLCTGAKAVLFSLTAQVLSWLPVDVA